MKRVFFIVFISTLFVYLFWANSDLIKKIVGYNAPAVEGPEISNPGRDENDEGLGFLNVPDGFRISVAAENLDGPRVIAFDPNGRMLVSETKAGRVMIFEDKDGDDKFEDRTALIEDLRSPHGLAFLDWGAVTYLYIAETHQVARYKYDLEAGKLTDGIGENIAALPPDGRHSTRTILFGPNWRDRDLIKGTFPVGGFYSDRKLYISVGSSCDVCEETTWKRAAILESDPDGTFTGEFAGGLRNSVFLALHPETGEIWATEMGRDNLGDNLPPDEINIVKVAGKEHEFGARRFGWPFCYGNKIKDETFSPPPSQRIDIPTDCSMTEAPVIEIPAHSAPLGLAFVPDRWEAFAGDLLVAYHGSWNRSEPTGYKLVRFGVDKNGNVSETSDFITGWLSENKKKVYGRPVDLKFSPDGALYVSDDAAGAIYRVIFEFHGS